jgi:hypothetical protein
MTAKMKRLVARYRLIVIVTCSTLGGLSHAVTAQSREGAGFAGSRASGGAAGAGAESAQSYAVAETQALSSCYECTTQNFRTVYFSTLEDAAESSDPVIPGSCHEIQSEVCRPYDPCASFTLCGSNPRSTTGICIGDGCIDCDLWATCIDSDGMCMPEAVQCSSEAFCKKPAPSPVCGG